MARSDKATIIAAVIAKLGASEDPEGLADLVASQGRINVAAEPGEIGPAIERLKPLPGYRWIVINPADLFTASPMTFGSKVGIMDPTGRVLKNADLPRPK
jgi:hypothetical protein